MSDTSMPKRLNIARSPVTAAVASGVLMLAALTGVIFAATSASGAGTTTTASSYAAVPLNQGPVVLPKPCHVAQNQQTCESAASKQHRAKQVKKQPTQSLPTVAPGSTSP
jgi:hypothetical protein